MCVEVVITNFLAATGQSAGLYKSLPNRGRSSENNSNGKQIDIWKHLANNVYNSSYGRCAEPNSLNTAMIQKGKNARNIIRQ